MILSNHFAVIPSRPVSLKKSSDRDDKIWPFPSSEKNKIWSFQVVVAQRQQKNVQKKRDALAELLFAN